MDKRHPSGDSGTQGTPDTVTLVELVALVADVASSAGVRVPREKIADIVTLAFEHRTLTGAIDPGYVRRLVNLTK